ncbi:hypothetical protein [Oecophyllibacter saccharovorans]|uniref:hypothetical protein n=1 Tax=Oecophyllibacter saccharovorans TaxID=2558360 RepID=UPI001142CE79|nr:hypothetical protein [Oecophyllibacter saccharovorans]QDH15691.1 hypothetical protein E3E11_07320 [Oecophyllibacter saccharovorans]TPW36710.1 hypothetical protein E3203_02890 [Oecophyllibacter saccharovorans]
MSSLPSSIIAFFAAHLVGTLAVLGCLIWAFLAFLNVKTPLLDWFSNRFGKDKPPQAPSGTPGEAVSPQPFTYAPPPRPQPEPPASQEGGAEEPPKAQ